MTSGDVQKSSRFVYLQVAPLSLVSKSSAWKLVGEVAAPPTNTLVGLAATMALAYCQVFCEEFGVAAVAATPALTVVATFRNVGQERDLAGALDRLLHLALVAPAGAGDPA